MRTMRPTVAAGRAALVVTVVAGPAVRADTPRDTPAAIEVDRDAAPGGRVSLGFDGGEPVDAWGASLALGWLDRPIALQAGAFGPGSLATQPVRRRETLAIGAAIAVGDRLVLDGVVRGSHQVGDRLAAAGDPAHLASFVFQDLRLAGRIRIVGDDDRAALLRGELTLPTGNADQFAGDASWTAAWSLIGRATLARGIAVSASAGIRLHGAEVTVGNRLIGDALFGAIGAAVPLSALGASGDLGGRIRLTAAVLGALGDHVGGSSGASPAEARLGAQIEALPGLTIAATGGIGLDDQIGAPRLRTAIELAWTPRVPHPPPDATPQQPPPEDDDSDEP